MIGFAIAAAVVVIAALALWWWLARDGADAGRENAPVLLSVIEEPTSGDVVATLWSQPSAVIIEGDQVYILDTGNNRILATDGEGVVNKILCETDDCAFTLAGPEDMEVHEGLFYVANTGRGTIEVIDQNGSVVRTLELPSDSGTPRATGVYVADDGTVYASDWSSGRIAIFGPDGAFQNYFGEAEGPGPVSFVEPSGLTFDNEGNIYVAEFGVGRVQKVSPGGRHLAMFWMIPGAIDVSEATDVAIADNGFVYMTDNKRSMVHVFSESARYLGILGLLDASRVDSPGALLRPYGIDVEGDEVTVIDRRRGQLVFEVNPEFYVRDRDI